MANGKMIEVPLNDEQFAMVAADVARGGYASPAELVQEALWEWHLNHSLEHDDVMHLRKLWDEGVASGPAKPADLREVFKEARARLQRAKLSRAG